MTLPWIAMVLVPAAGPIELRRHEIDSFPSGYQVAAADLKGALNENLGPHPRARMWVSTSTMRSRRRSCLGSPKFRSTISLAKRWTR